MQERGRESGNNTREGRGKKVISLDPHASSTRVIPLLSPPFSHLPRRLPLLQVRGINNYLEKHGIITYVSVVIQFLDGAEHGNWRCCFLFVASGETSCLDQV